MLTPEGFYYNFSGCGNTFNCNNPVVRNFVVECLRHWVTEYHIDGFRFDLASILGRAPNGAPLGNPPLLELLAGDPVLGRTKLIAEAWDAGGLYQVGCFPAYGRWAEWNGRYRDDVRRFWRGEHGLSGAFATRLAGSSDLYQPGGRNPYHSINFVTSHDKGNIVKGTVKAVEAKGAVIELEKDVEGYLRASEIARDRVEDVSKHLSEGQQIEAVIINIDRKSRSIQLSIKQKDAAEESAALQKHAAESSASAGTTNLGALLKAKLGGSKDKE